MHIINNNRNIEMRNRKYFFQKIYVLTGFIYLSFLTSSVANIIIHLINVHGVSIFTSSLLPVIRYFVCIAGGVIIAPYIDIIGHKKSIIFAYFSTGVISIIMIINHGVISSMIFFFVLGLSYTLLKTSFYSIIKLVCRDKNSHSSFVCLMESFYMFGTYVGFWLFSIFIGLKHLEYMYYLFLVLSIIFTLFPLVIEINEVKIKNDKTNKRKFGLETLNCFKVPVLLMFCLIFFSYMVIEKGLADWLPTYNNLILNISVPISIQIASIFGISMGMGRLCFCFLNKYFNKDGLLISFVGIALYILIMLGINIYSTMPSSVIKNWTEVPFSAFLLPFIGFFIGPVFPVLSSSLLTLFSEQEQTKITGFIIIIAGCASVSSSFVIGSMIGIFSNLEIVMFITLLVGIVLAALIYARVKKMLVSQTPIAL